MNIRAAVIADLAECVRLSEEFYQIAGYKEDIEFCPDSTTDWLKMSLEQGLLFVADTGKTLAGLIVGVKSPFVMNRKYDVACELAWYLSPEYREGSAGIKLLKVLENAANRAGVKMLSMMNLECVDPERTDRIYKALGYVKAETTYLKVF